jgi:nucleotide-binding universal stress UspA family protein
MHYRRVLFDKLTDIYTGAVRLFEKILVPLDGSEHSLRALEVAIQIAKKFQGRMTLVHVFSVSVVPMVLSEPTTLTPARIPAMTPGEVAKIVEAARGVGNRLLSEGEERVRSEGIEVESVLREGDTVQEITRLSREGNFDLIVMGVKGVSKLRELLVGSVSEGVIKHASCPVLVVK